MATSPSDLTVLPVGGNLPPPASYTFSPAIPIAGEVVHFDGTSSSDLDGAIVAHTWNFGDRTEARAPDH